MLESYLVPKLVTRYNLHVCVCLVRPVQGGQAGVPQLIRSMTSDSADPIKV